MIRVFWDTNLFIYLFEENPDYAGLVLEVRQSMLTRNDGLCTSALTVGEILVKPMAMGNMGVVNLYRSFFEDGKIEVLPFDLAAAGHFARIRKDRRISRPDAIQLACAAARGVDLFITNDSRLSKVAVPGIRFITGLDRAPL